MVGRGAGRARDPGRPVPAADRTRRGGRHAAAGGGRPDRTRSGRARDRRRLPRHRLRRGRRARRATDDFAYVSSGTWSLVGLELDEPVLSEESRAANFTNEGGVDARVRYLRNEGGLWLLQESLRTWREAGDDPDQDTLLAEAARLSTGGPTVDVDAAEFLPPGDMPSRIRAACQASGQEPPSSAAAVVRCILDSLAVAYARTVREAERLSGRTRDGDPRRRRRLPERVALPTHGRPVRPAGAGRSGGGHGPGQPGRAGPGRGAPEWHAGATSATPCGTRSR